MVYNNLIYEYLIDTGDVYVWGFGILGFGPKITKIVQPTLIPATLFGNNAYQKNTKVSLFYLFFY